MTKKAPRQAKDSASITRSQPFAARIGVGDDGVTKKLVVESKAWYQHALNRFKAGESVTLEVHNRKAKRTEAQNRYYWGVYLPLIARETGENNLDRLHELFKGKFLTQGVVEVLGEKVRMKKSTTELGVGEFCEFVMNIEAETGIEAPPTESYDLAPLRATPTTSTTTATEGETVYVKALPFHEPAQAVSQSPVGDYPQRPVATSRRSGKIGT